MNEVGWFLVCPEGPLAVPAQISLQTRQVKNPEKVGLPKLETACGAGAFFCDQILALTPLSNPSLSFPSFLFPHSLAPWRERRRRSALQQMPVLALWYLASLCCLHLCLLVFVYFVYFCCFFFKWNLNFDLPCLPLMFVFMVDVVLSLPKNVR